MAKTHRCSVCLKIQDISQFYTRSLPRKGLYNDYKKCRSESAKRRYHGSPEVRKRINERSLANWTRYKFKLTSVEYYQKLLAQEVCCAICGQCQSKMNLDHCHTTGKVREFLCNRCNFMIGQSGEDPDLLRKAASYLEKHRALND